MHAVYASCYCIVLCFVVLLLKAAIEREEKERNMCKCMRKKQNNKLRACARAHHRKARHD